MQPVREMSPALISEHLAYLVSQLPKNVEQHDPSGGVLRPWVRALPLRYQGVLITAIRGCDVAAKEDPSKHLTRMIRRAILNPADPRETTNPGGFFGFNDLTMVAALKDFLHSLDQYPLHYIMHLTHACEVIGYTHMEERSVMHFFQFMYQLICFTLHLEPESFTHMSLRLTEDRVEKGTTARNFI